MRSTLDSTNTYETVESLRAHLREMTLKVVWRQWSAIGGMTASDARAKSLVDPEALILISLALAHDEPRLNDILGDWAKVNSDLISVQRTNNLAKHFNGIETGLRSFARTAFEDGKDHRWKGVMRDHPTGLKQRQSPDSRKMRATRARPIEGPALVLRLRLAFGVGIKADILAFLLSAEGEAWASVGAISAATNYTVAAVRKALSNLAEARFVEHIDDTRAEYRVNHPGWRELLGIALLPAWRGWAIRYAFVADFLAWTGDPSVRAMTPYLLESRSRALLAKHERAFRWQRVLPRNETSTGRSRKNSLQDTVHTLGEWIVQVA